MTLEEKHGTPSTGSDWNKELLPEVKFEEGTLEADLIEEGQSLMPDANDRYFVDGSDLPSLATWSDESLLHGISHQVSMCKLVSPLAYMTGREEYLAASFELNRRGLVAPAFRPTPSIPPASRGQQGVHMIIQRDRIVIDAHWLFCRGIRPDSNEHKWENLIGAAEMDWDLVSDFAAAKIKSEFRASSILGLTTQVQCQLVALRGETVQNRFKQLAVGDMSGSKRVPPRYEIVRLCINRWCELDRRMPRHASKYLAYAKACELLGPSARISEVSRLAALIIGSPPLSDRTANSVIRKLEAKVRELSSTLYSGPIPERYAQTSSGTS